VTVNGDTTVTLANFEIAEPQRPNNPDWVTNSLDTPLLATITGTLTLVTQEQPLAPGDEDVLPDGLEYSFGLMPHLMTLNNLVFHQPFENRYAGGLGKVVEITGNVDITWDTGEVHLDQTGMPGDGEDFLTSLALIDGAFDFRYPGANLGALFPNLGRVGGDLTLNVGSGIQTSNILRGLTQVTGVLTLNVEYSGPLFPQLVQIGGLTLSPAPPSPLAPILGRIGTTPLQIGSSGITFEGSTNTRFPFAATPNITATAPVTLTDNVDLCVCPITCFVEALQAQGWSGTFTSSGNGTAPTCPSAPANGPPPVCPCGWPTSGAPPG